MHNKRDNYAPQLVYDKSLSELIEALLNNIEQHGITNSDKHEN